MERTLPGWWKVGVAGLFLGFFAVLFLPSSLLFIDDTMPGGSAAMGAQYACPMFCVVMDEMPEDGRCPVCGMDLTEVSTESPLNPDERNMIGLLVDVVTRMPLVKTIRVVGEVETDETGLSRITTRVAGWLETVAVDSTWQSVKEGEALAEIYSPELFAAQQEFLASPDSLRPAAERRLRLLGVAAPEIAELVRSKQVKETLGLRSPRAGVVVKLGAVAGNSVKKGETLYHIADLDRVWVQTEVFEADLPWVRVGQVVRLTSDAPGAPAEGRITFVDPVIGRSSRTARVRIEVENPVGEDGVRPLRIGQRLDGTIEARLSETAELVPPGSEPAQNPLVVPRSAVLRTGRRVVVYVLLTGEGDFRNYQLDPKRLPDSVMYQLMEVEIGPIGRSGAGTEEFYPILSPDVIEEGMVVVTRGNLLLDSQAQLSGKPSLLFPEGNRGGGGDPHAGH